MLRPWSSAPGRSVCLLTSLRRNLPRQEVTAAVGLVSLLGTQVCRQHQPAFMPVCYTMPSRATSVCHIKEQWHPKEISAEFRGMVSRKACFSDPLWPLWMDVFWICCWMCFVHRDWVTTLTLYSVTKKRTGCTQGLSWVSISLLFSGNSTNRKCLICLFVGTIGTTSCTWLGLLQSILWGSE